MYTPFLIGFDKQYGPNAHFGYWTLIKAYLHDMFWQTCLKADQQSYCSYARLRGMFDRAVSEFSKIYFFCLFNFYMEYYNLVIPVCMLMKTAAYCNILVSDVVNPKNSFSLSLYCFYAENPSFIDTETLLSYGGSRWISN